MADDRPKQVVLVTIDTLRADHLGATANHATLTPQLDVFATDAVTFKDAVANSTVTRASHASMLTGLYPWRHGVRDNVGRLSDRAVTLTSMLRERGFATAGIVSSSPLADLDTSFDYFDATFDQNNPNQPTVHYKSPERATELAAEWIATHRKESFFLWVHYFPPHGPYTPPEQFLLVDETSDERLPISGRNYDEGKVPAYQALPGVDDPATYRSRYAANVRYVDFHVGAFLAQLKELGIYDDLMVIITSDHGESLGEHNWFFTHGNMVYWEQAAVPLLLKLPENARGGSTATSPAQSTDIAPTILDVLDLTVETTFDGRSLLGEPTDRLRYVESTYAELRSVIDGRWKYSRRFGEKRLASSEHPRELFFLSDDPDERANLAESYPEHVRRLEAELRRHSGPDQPPSLEIDPEQLERLRGLGYVR